MYRIQKWLADSYDNQIVCRLRCHAYRKTRMDGTHQQMYRGFAAQK